MNQIGINNRKKKTLFPELEGIDPKDIQPWNEDCERALTAEELKAGLKGFIHRLYNC